MPSDDAPCNVDPGCARTGAGPAFDFRRLGLRKRQKFPFALILLTAIVSRPCTMTANMTTIQQYDCGTGVSALLMSPLIPKGSVFQRPSGPFNNSEFDLTSVCSTAKNLFDLPGFLTQRVGVQASPTMRTALH